MYTNIIILVQVISIIACFIIIALREQESREPEVIEGVLVRKFHFLISFGGHESNNFFHENFLCAPIPEVNSFRAWGITLNTGSKERSFYHIPEEKLGELEKGQQLKVTVTTFMFLKNVEIETA